MTIPRDTKRVTAQRRADVFNERYAPGDAVMYIPSVGGTPQLDRTYSPAWEHNGLVLVRLASRTGPVDADRCFSPPVEALPGAGGCYERTLPIWKLAAAFVLGFAFCVLVAELVPAAKATAPEHIVIDCYEPGESAADADADSGRAQA